MGQLDDLQRARLERLRARLAFSLTRGSDAPPLLLHAARRLVPIDAGVADGAVQLAGDAKIDDDKDGLRLVDMPGYGYAAAPKSQVASWTALIHKFLLGRASLARVYVLIDARHGLKDVDLDILKTLDRSAVSYQIVLTKADQVKAAELQARIAETEAALAKHPAAFPTVLATSSRSATGMESLRAAMAKLLEERAS